MTQNSCAEALFPGIVLGLFETDALMLMAWWDTYQFLEEGAVAHWPVDLLADIQRIYFNYAFPSET